MKNFFLSLLLTAICAYLVQLIADWWTIALVALVVAYFVRQTSLLTFLTGFLSVFLLWIGYAWFLSSANEGILLAKVTELFQSLTKGNSKILYLLTGLCGGLVGGFAALTGRFLSVLRD